MFLASNGTHLTIGCLFCVVLSNVLNCWQNIASVIDKRMNVRRWHDDADEGKLRYSEKKPAPGAAVSATNITCTDLDSNTLLRRGRPATNCPSRTLRCTLHHVKYSGPFSIFKLILSQEMALTKVVPCYNHAVLGIGLNLSRFCVDAWSLPWKIPRRSQ